MTNKQEIEIDQEALKTHTKQWIEDIILRTNPIKPNVIRPIIEDLYRAADLKAPVVAIAGSPFVAALAFGFGSVQVKNGLQGEELSKELDEFILACVDNSRPEDFVGSIMNYLRADGGEKIIETARNRWAGAIQGGNMWAQSDCFLTAFRDVCGLQLEEYKKYQYWEKAAIHGSVRFLHKEFCIVCDFPEFIKQDDEHQPHCETGPSHKWRDGYTLSFWHGRLIPNNWVGENATLSVSEALGQENAEDRRCACEIIGWDKVLTAPSLNPKIIDKDEPHIGTLIEVDLPDAPNQRFIQFVCGTGRTFAEPVNSHEYDTALKANAAGNGWRPNMKTPPEQFIPIIRT